MGSDAEEEVEKVYIPSVQKKTAKPAQQRIFTKQENPIPDISSSVERVESSPPIEGTVAVTNYTVAADLQDLDDKIKSMMMFSEKRATDNRKMRTCKVCGKEGPWTDLRNHIEAQHITGVSHTCNICGTTTRSRPAMAMHKKKESHKK